MLNKVAKGAFMNVDDSLMYMQPAILAILHTPPPKTWSISTLVQMT